MKIKSCFSVPLILLSQPLYHYRPGARMSEKAEPILLDLLHGCVKERFLTADNDSVELLYRIIAHVADERAAFQEDLARVTEANPTKTMPPIVLWLDAPISQWNEKTYAVFLVCLLQHALLVPYEGEEPVSPERMREVSGYIIHYLNVNSEKLYSYYANVVECDGRPEAWLPGETYQRLEETWLRAMKKCDSMGNELVRKDATAAKNSLFESIMNKNISLLQKGLGLTSCIIPEMLMHYYTARLKEEVMKIMGEMEGGM